MGIAVWMVGRFGSEGGGSWVVEVGGGGGQPSHPLQYTLYAAPNLPGGHTNSGDKLVGNYVRYLCY